MYQYIGYTYMRPVCLQDILFYYLCPDSLREVWNTTYRVPCIHYY